MDLVDAFATANVSMDQSRITKFGPSSTQSTALRAASTITGHGTSASPMG
jgi:hypothetical protein